MEGVMSQPRWETLKYYFSVLNEIYKKKGFYAVKNKCVEKLKKEVKYIYRISQSKNIIHAYVKLGRKIKPRNFTDAYPFKILWVDPNKITHGLKDTTNKWGYVVGGRWHKYDLSNKVIYRSMKSHFNDNISWEETILFENTSMGSQHKNRLVEKYKKYDLIYDNIKREGYKTQTDLNDNDKSNIIATTDVPHPELNEIGVNIDRDGSFIWSGAGLHRLAIAQILDLDEVAVQVRTRHTEWQKVRNDLRNICKPHLMVKEEFGLHEDLHEFI